MKKKTLCLKLFFLIVLLVTYSCSNDDDWVEPIISLDEQVEVIMDNLKTEVLTSLKENDKGSLDEASLNFKTEDAIIGEAVGRCKRTYIKMNIDLDKGDVLSETETIQRINNSIFQIKQILQNASAELNAKQINENKKWSERQQIIKEYLDDIVVGFKDALPHNYLRLLDTPRVRNEYSMMVASIKFKDQYDEIGNYYLATVDLLKNYTYDAPFICVYYDQNFEEGHDTEILMPVYMYFDDIPFSYNGKELKITTKIWEKTEQLSYLHKGSTADLGQAWIDMEAWAQAKGIKFGAPSREVYWHEDHIDLGNIVTELQLVTLP